jgi:DNA-binding transcriptional LysR family regulator
MELRHLRYFIAVAQELHFARAAERLEIEQSPLSRAIKVLEYDLGTQLFERTTRGTRLTYAGQVFLEEAQRVLLTLEQAKASVKAAAAGFRGTLRIALSDGVALPRLASLLARCRDEDPEVDMHLSEVPRTQQLNGLRDGLYDAGFAHTTRVGEGIDARAAWSDALVIAAPASHPVLVHQRVPIEELIRHPLVLCHPEICDECYRNVQRILRTVNEEPTIVEQASSFELLMTLVAAGYGLGVANESHVAASRHPDVVTRPLAGKPVLVTTYLLTAAGEPSGPLTRFIDRTIARPTADRHGIRHSCRVVESMDHNVMTE